MSGKRKKRIDVNNKRLDLFLTELKIEQDKKQKILDYVENLTFDTLSRRSAPKLRLEKSKA